MQIYDRTGRLLQVADLAIGENFLECSGFVIVKATTSSEAKAWKIMTQ